MVDSLALCAVAFLAKEPIPQPLRHLYETTYRCNSFKPLQKNLAKEKLVRINDYFVQNNSFWPVVRYPLDDRAFASVKKWKKQGIVPGFILPRKSNQSFHNDPRKFEQLTALYNVGVLPIATVADTKKRTLESARYYWCMHGMCPVGWYLPQGIDASIYDAPEGFYVSEPYWRGDKNFPLPNALMHIGGKTVLSMSRVWLAEITQTTRKYGVLPTRYFNVNVQEKWEWLGVDYSVRNSELQSSFLGKAILAFGNFSFWLWDRIHITKVKILSSISENFSWIALVFAVVNLGVLMIASFWYKRKDIA